MKTPYFVIQQDEIDHNFMKLKNALQEYWPNYHIGYSYKTNSLQWIIKHFYSLGCYAEVVSDDEYNLALATGVSKERIIYNGIAKSKESFLEAIKNHAVVNIDAEYEIEWLNDLPANQYAVGIRVNFDLEEMCPGQTQCGEEGERFGFCYENGELIRAINQIQNKGIRVNGLHLHKSSKTRMPDIYHAIAIKAVEIAKKYKLQLEYIDIGGGFFGGLHNKPQFPEYFSMISNILKEYFIPQKTALIVEPGMALIGAFIDYVSSVIDVKITNRNVFVITDGSRIQIDPLMNKADYSREIHRAEGKNRTILEKQVLSGFTCMEHDRLFTVKNEQQILPGDCIVYHKVGAYTMGLSPLFIKWYPDVYVRNGEKNQLVRERWTANEYLSKVIGD